MVKYGNYSAKVNPWKGKTVFDALKNDFFLLFWFVSRVTNNRL